MSYPGLIADTHHTQACSEQLLDQIVFFIVQSGAAEVADRGGLHQCLAISSLDKAALAAIPQPIGDHLHRPAEFQVFPDFRKSPPILYFGQSLRVSEKLVARRTLRAQAPAR